MLGLLKAVFGRRGAQVSPQDAVAYLNRGAALVDVREKGEFARGYAYGACNIPLGELRAGGAALLDARLPAGTREVVLVCQSGMRSRVAQSALSGKDARIYLNLAGGMGSWQRHGLPTVRHD
jgi:rhodanese-related sulfurtransferase